MKKLRITAFVFVLMACAAAAVFAAGQGETRPASTADGLSGKLVVWSFTDELGGMLDEFQAVHPGVDIEFTIFPNDDEVYLNRINNTMRSRSATPDVFTGERAWFRQMIEAGYWLPVSGAPYNAENLTDAVAEYVVDLGRNDAGEITALSWQATPGGLFYRRSIAREVLGTDDPAVVSEWTSDLDKFYELGEMIKEAYGGERYLLSGYGDMSEFVYNRRTQPYVQGDRVVIPNTMVEYMELAREMRDNRIEAGATTWSPAWFSSMTDASVFAYILPTWGLHYVLKPNAEPEADAGRAEWSGDWALADPPAPYSWGGTWIGVNTNSRQKDLAWELVKFIGSNPEFQEAWARQTGDFVSNMNVVERIKDDFSDPFLGGQNHYAYFAEQVEAIDVSFIGPWDFQIQNAWGDQVDLYANGQKTLDQAINDFKAAVRDIIPNIREVVVER
ncbi:extracellular solute-binding protein [Spirochaeta africana]|uniref:ABC-type sugar transport system, periplasmic component n=1 Tax=Spirochaeta africana (strain ATCC 700263 / DSM 8902 / Z-7692) TaxID=889378 RepID=H9UIW3_SPIAZ|nr:ABC transporter substrate-binding protein [Spirochaeta africana]AFG37456.1 ABC-type sugar transport system, periplasmic component [Spirochaeta africana DSM 8902]